MATTITGIGQSKIITNLDTYNHTTRSTQMYKVNVTISELPPSGITITIKQGSNTIASTSAPAAAQGTINLEALINCTSGDVIGVVLASSLQSDAAKNSFKGILNIQAGAV